jgi:hypothetical protein
MGKEYWFKIKKINRIRTENEIKSVRSLKVRQSQVRKDILNLVTNITVPLQFWGARGSVVG